MRQRIRDFIMGKENGLNERLYRLVIAVGLFISAIGILKTLTLMERRVVIVPIVILLVILVLVAVVAFQYNRTQLAATLVALILILGYFPVMFFIGGGIQGGASAWFALSVIYIFIMFRGWKLILFALLSIGSGAVTYALAYLKPELVQQIPDLHIAYLDSLCGTVIVGLAGGLCLQFYMKIYEEERKVTLAQKEELEKVSQNKNNFFASMSHEIRTTINTILGLNEMILRENKEDQTREYAYHIKGAGKMLLSLVNDILDLSKIEMSKMEIVPVPYDTKELIHSLVNMIKVPIADKQLELLLDIDEKLPAKLLGDEKRMQQIVLNLLSNAVKYTEVGSVTLTVKGVMQEGDLIQLTIMVSDTGIGIRKEDVATLYDTFKRVDSKKNRKVEGSGLGLTITKQLVELMGGTITVDSIYTKGSTFTVNVTQQVLDVAAMGPLEYHSHEQVHQEEYYKRQFEAPEARVLIVDDNEINAIVTEKLLSQTKMQIDVANSGEECLQKTKEKYYNVILLDYMMPEMSGPQTLHNIRQQENGLCRDSAIIALTANAIDDVENLYENNGFDDYLEKPIQAELLEKIVQKYIPKEIIEYSVLTTKNEDKEEALVLTKTGRKRKKIYITTDCVSDLPADIMQNMDIRLMYLYIKTRYGRFADMREINSDNLYTDFIKEEGVFSDSVSVEEYEEFFAQILTEADEMIHISMASKAGKSYGVALEAAKCFDHVHVVDSGHISCGEALVTMYAAKLAMEGNSVEEIIDKIDEVRPAIHTRFLLPTAELFYQRGYTNGAVEQFFKFFRLHPMLACHQSKVIIRGFYSGELEKTWKKFIRKQLRNPRRISDDIIFITFAGCNARQQEYIRSEVQKLIPFKRVIMQRASVSVACNAGMYSIGMAYYRLD